MTPRAAALRAALVAAAFTLACQDDHPTGPGGPSVPLAAVNAAANILVGAGDIASCIDSTDEWTANLLDSIDGTVFTAGDNAYPNGAAADYANCYAPSWGRHKARTRPAPGNHEYVTPGAAAYFAYFGAAAGDPAKGFYSYNIGTWHIIELNSSIDISATSSQLQWLSSDLSASNARCTAAIWHHPRFSSGTTHGSDTRLQPAWDVLYQYGADVVISGHDHDYERFAPQKPGGAADPLFGIREFIVGTGGDASTTFGTIVANSEARSSGTPGVLKLTLDSASYRWDFIPIAGHTFTDTGTQGCHTRPLPLSLPPVAAPGGPYLGNGTIHFDGRGSTDPDGDYPLIYAWDFGDGHTSSGAIPSNTYAADGLYTVKLIVTDRRGTVSPPAVTTALITNHASAPIVLSGAANISKCTTNDDETTAQVLDQLDGWVVAIGDNAFPHATATDYHDCYDPTWGRHRARTWAVMGNHEYDLGNADAASDYFGASAGPRDKQYYSFNVGDWHVIVLNDNGTYVPYGAGSVQEQWLRADLAANPKQCTMAIWHTPLFLSSDTPGYTENPSRRILWTDLYAAGVDVVLNGNQHHYERMFPMRPDGTRDSVAGIRQFNAGTGGESVALPTVTVHPNSEARISAFGVVSFTLHTGSYDWRFLPVAGATGSDAGSSPCHGPPAKHPPTASAGGPYSSTDGTVHLDGSGSSDPDGDALVAYRWDMGDGNVNTDGARPTHTYTSDGTYTVTLTVTDATGAASTPVTTTVSVSHTNTSWVFAGAGNIAKCTNTNDDSTAAVLDGLPGYVFTLGDMAFPSGRLADFQNCYGPSWGKHMTRTFPVFGNHEYDSSSTAAGAFGYFGSRAGTNGQGYYSFDLGEWHIVVLNDNANYVPYGSGSTQEQWLRADLAATTKRCIMALWHTPLFLSSNTSGYTENPSRRVLWNDLYAARADVVLNGNEHDYERMTQMRPDGTPDAATGIREFNVGTGGEVVAMPTVAIHPGSEARGADYGVLKLTLFADHYDWQFLPAAGGTFTDAGSTACH